MNLLADIRRVFLKDVRVLRIHLLVLFALGLGAVVLTRYPWLPHANDVSPVFIMGLIFMEIALGITVIQADPAGREFRFLLTRPVPPVAIGLAKALFIGVVLVLPFWVTQEYLLARAQVPLSLADHLLMVFEASSNLMEFICIIALVAVFCRDTRRVVITLVVLILGVIGWNIWWQSHTWAPKGLPDLPYFDQRRLNNFRSLLSTITFAWVSLIAIGVRYRTRGFRIPAGITAAGVALSFLALYCPWNFAAFLQDHDGDTAMLSPDALARIHMTVLPPRDGAPTYSISREGGYTGTENNTVNQQVRLEGVQMPCYVQTLDYHATITLRSGKKFESNFTDFPGHDMVGGLGMQQMMVAAGVHLPYFFATRTDQDLPTFDLASYPAVALRGEDLTGATIKGVITLGVRRACMAGILPLKWDASFVSHRSRYEIIYDFSWDQDLRFTVEDSSVPLVLRGDLPGIDTPGNLSSLQTLPVYRPYWEALDSSSEDRTSTTSVTTLGLSHTTLGATYHGSPWDPRDPHPWKDFPPGWQSDVDLVLIGSQYCGEVRIPYEIDNVNLTLGARERIIR